MFDFFINSATESNVRRFEAKELKEYFRKRVKGWKNIEIKKPEIPVDSKRKTIDERD